MMSVLHIYAQQAPHDEAFIVGNREGLLALRRAIDAALKNGQSKESAFVSDGEGFDVHVILQEGDLQSPGWIAAAVPYTVESQTLRLKAGACGKIRRPGCDQPQPGSDLLHRATLPRSRHPGVREPAPGNCRPALNRQAGTTAGVPGATNRGNIGAAHFTGAKPRRPT
jgi:hypothetical protein